MTSMLTSGGGGIISPRYVPIYCYAVTHGKEHMYLTETAGRDQSITLRDKIYDVHGWPAGPHDRPRCLPHDARCP